MFCHIDVARTATIPRSVVLAFLMSRKRTIPLALLRVNSGTDQVDFLIIPANTRSSLLLCTPGRQESSCSFVHRIPDYTEFRKSDDTTGSTS